MNGLENLFLAAVVVGAVDPTCTLEKVCVPGYTKTVRPSASYTSVLKAKQMKALHLPGKPGDYEEDHMIPLELCGAPRDPKNLTPERWDRARRKDQEENLMHKAVCAGRMSLRDAQRLIVTYE